MEKHQIPPGWYPDPWCADALRWYDGSQWTSASHRTWRATWRHSRYWPWPRNRGDWATCSIAAVVGLAIWIPTMALHPLYSDWPRKGAEDNGSPWLLPLTLLAALLLGAVASRHWSVVATGILAPQFALAPYTTPRGDNDGLWALIFFFLAFVGVLSYLLAGLGSAVVTKFYCGKSAGSDNGASP